MSANRVATTHTHWNNQTEAAIITRTAAVLAKGLLSTEFTDSCLAIVLRIHVRVRQMRGVVTIQVESAVFWPNELMGIRSPRHWFQSVSHK